MYIVWKQRQKMFRQRRSIPSINYFMSLDDNKRYFFHKHRSTLLINKFRYVIHTLDYFNILIIMITILYIQSNNFYEVTRKMSFFSFIFHLLPTYKFIIVSNVAIDCATMIWYTWIQLRTNSLFILLITSIIISSMLGM